MNRRSNVRLYFASCFVLAALFVSIGIFGFVSGCRQPEKQAGETDPHPPDCTCPICTDPNDGGGDDGLLLIVPDGGGVSNPIRMSGEIENGGG